MAYSVSFVFLGIPIFDKFIDSDEVSQASVEFFYTVVGFAMACEVLHVLLSIGVVCL